ncbi:hypothetical protein ACGFT2_22630 [Streptomyces sp. NPDC048514]|uniref:hypothetical protein n=1 Tax=Streptomyces sp. NPDC048514 TaxID=3365564 RepID=UPI00371EFFA2
MKTVPLLLVLLPALILFGTGFALKALWWIALVVIVLCLLGFLVRPAGTRPVCPAAHCPVLVYSPD